ncbi:hypothetical protein [Nocardia grenadensis]|uniref:hypothetical protein n=1 Tax=Nocardia grenadensis TaxID=931537 RepID=UPI0007A4C9B7|nr:hypothetical protein [Nocardia grenadensis]
MELASAAHTEDRSTTMYDDHPGLFSHVPTEPEPYALPADDNRPVFLTAARETDGPAAPDAGGR